MTRDLLFMAISLFTWGVGEGMFFIFQPLYLQKWGADPLEIGGILGLVGVSMMVAQVPAGYLSDRVGSRPVMWASWVLGTIATVLMALAGSLTVFVAGLLVYGLTSFVVAPMNSYITSVRGSWSTVRALTFVSAMFHLGAVAGPIVGGLLGEAYGLPVVYRISAVIFLISTLIVLQVRRAPAEEEVHSVHAQQPNLVQNTRFLGMLALIFITMFAMYMPQPLTANYLRGERGLSLATIGWLGAAGSLGNATWMLLLGHLQAKTGFLLGQVLVGVFALILWRGEQTWLFFVGFFFLGGHRLARSMALAYTRSLVKAREVGLAFGLVETANATATILAPLAAGWLYSRDPRWMYITALALMAGALLINAAALTDGWKKLRTLRKSVSEP